MSGMFGWDEYYLRIANTVSLRSRCTSTSHGAVICDEFRRPLGFGYNGFPQGGDDKYYASLGNPYEYVIHAEVNAILNCTRQPRGGTLYVTGCPCIRCAVQIVQAGIKRVVYGSRRCSEGFIGTKEVGVAGSEEAWQGFLQKTDILFHRHGIEVQRVETNKLYGEGEYAAERLELDRLQKRFEELKAELDSVYEQNFPPDETLEPAFGREETLTEHTGMTGDERDNLG